jgi:hypothetical protein
MTPLRQLLNALAWATDVFIELVWALVRLPARALRRRRRRSDRDQREAERLDRIRNPSKYLGK